MNCSYKVQTDYRKTKMEPLGFAHRDNSYDQNSCRRISFTLILTGYAFAQDTVTGAPAGTAPMKPPPITDMAKTAGKSMHKPMHNMSMKMHKPMHQKKPMAAPMAAPTDAPK
jgi:hypothetical protein